MNEDDRATPLTPDVLARMKDDMTTRGLIANLEQSPVQARVVYDPVRDLLVATVLATGAMLEARDPRELAELLFAVGVRHGHVSMPDWREGDIAPAGGHKIALNHRLNQLGQAKQ